MPRKLIILLAICSFSCFGACASSWSNGYTYCQELTIDATQAGGSDLTNYTVSDWITNADLATVANGGEVQSAAGKDIVYFFNNNGTGVLPYELVVYTATTGAHQIPVQVPSVSASVSTKTYRFL